MTDQRITQQFLLGLLEGAIFAGALRRKGKPCRTPLPEDLESRSALVRAHLLGEPRELTFVAENCDPWVERVDSVVLAGFCPASDGLCRWMAIDLDADDHGERGLADPVHAARTIAERADNAGLSSGLLVARSRGGRGRHVFLLPPNPVALADAVIAIAALIASAYRIAASDVHEGDVPHAFRCANENIAQPGDAGAIELIPRSTTRPKFGWALTLPASGALRKHGGGLIVDPFTDEPTQPECVPKCDPQAWSAFITEARAALSERSRARRRRRPRSRWRKIAHPDIAPHCRIDPQTRAFLEGRIGAGNRNNSAFAASMNLLGCGVDVGEAESLVLDGAAACGLPEREARAAFASANRAYGRKRRHG